MFKIFAKVVLYGILVQLCTSALSYGLYAWLPRFGIGGREPLEINGILALSLQPLFFWSTYIGELNQVSFLTSNAVWYSSLGLQVIMWGAIVHTLRSKDSRRFRLGLICMVVMLWVFTVAFPYARTKREEANTAQFLTDMRNSSYQTVTGELLLQWQKENRQMIVIDTRDHGDYANGHIPDAVNCAYPRDESRIQQDHRKRLMQTVAGNKDRTIVVYGAGPGDRSDHLAANALAV